MIDSPLLKRPTLARVCFENIGNDKVKMTIESAQSGAQIKKFGSIEISHEEFYDRPNDSYNSYVENRWAFQKFGIEI